MNRTFWLAAIFLVMIAVVAVTRMRLTSEQDGSAVSVGVRQLWQAPEAYRGTRVSASGLLRVVSSSDGDYFVIEEAEQYQIGVPGIERAALEPLVGQEVRVEGTLHIDATSGIFIDATVVQPEGSATLNARAALA